MRLVLGQVALLFLQVLEAAVMHFPNLVLGVDGSVVVHLVHLVEGLLVQAGLAQLRLVVLQIWRNAEVGLVVGG